MKRIFSTILSMGVLITLLLPAFTTDQASGAEEYPPSGSQAFNETNQSGAPWLDEAWHYRRLITITFQTPPAFPLTWYQVLVNLNDDNFKSFLLTNDDLSDIRFTLSDGTTLLNYWIETPWNPATKNAYIWVRVPELYSGKVIYLYYNNPSAVPISDGVSTFDGFDDDWGTLTGEGSSQNILTQPDLPIDGIEGQLFDWIKTGSPLVTPPGLLNLSPGTAVTSTSTFQKSAAGFRAKYGLGNGGERGGFHDGSSNPKTMIGDTNSLDELYLINYNTASNNTKLTGTWHNSDHVYELRWTTGKSEAYIDHAKRGESTNQVPGTTLPVTLISNASSGATLIVDWIYVRQFYNPEPTSFLGTEQALVKLELDMADTPDPVRPGVGLTYQLSVFNTSDINASGVVITDTLPINVEQGTISPSQGNCTPGGIILCDLGILLANSMANISIIVTPTVEGVITNTATIGSTEFELNLSDNYAEENSFVDATRPVVNWEAPVHTLGTYIANSSPVFLKASASDAGGVAYVQFIYYDKRGAGWTPIGTPDYTFPYQVSFDTLSLPLNDPFLFAVKGIDWAGNQSDIYNPPQYIYIINRPAIFLPLMIK